MLKAVKTMLSAGPEDTTLINRTPKRGWLVSNMREHLTAMIETVAPSASSASSSATPATSSSTSATPQQRSTRAGPFVLAQSSPLWAHRGNEALFKRSVWAQLCYTSSQSEGNVESRGGVRIPEAYWQVLFEDVQGRERVPGGEQLSGVDAKSYADGEARSVGGEGDGENAVRKVERDGSVGGGAGGGSDAGLWEEGDRVKKVEGDGSADERMDVD